MSKVKEAIQSFGNLTGMTAPPAPTGEGFYASARKWIIDNGLLTEHEYNDMIILTHMADKAIKNTEFFIDRSAQKIHQVVYLSRFAYLFYNRDRLQYRIESLIGHLIKNYEYELRVELARHTKKN